MYYVCVGGVVKRWVWRRAVRRPYRPYISQSPDPTLRKWEVCRSMTHGHLYCTVGWAVTGFPKKCALHISEVTAFAFKAEILLS